MKVSYDSGTFKCRCSFEERLIPHQAGFTWNMAEKVWITKSINVARRLDEYLDQSAREHISTSQPKLSPWPSPLLVPAKLKLMPFQQSAALFALSRNRSYLGLDPGLGKTPVSAVIAATLNEKKPITGLYICPPFLTRNTQIEFEHWAPTIKTSLFKKNVIDSWFTILPDSLLSRSETLNTIKLLVDSAALNNRPTVLFVDEAHRFKNDTAGRTKALFGQMKTKAGIASLFEKIIYLSGTPMPNRPIELFPVLQHSSHHAIDYMTKFEYAQKYCAAFEGQWGWDYSGASNVKDLVSRVHGAFMLRYRKADVLKELPPKTQEIVVLSQAMPPQLGEMSREILASMSKDDTMHGKIAFDLGKDELHLATYRRELGLAKVECVAEYIRAQLEDTDESFLVFAIHKDVIKELKVELEEYDPLVITGETPMPVRNEIIREFQRDAKRRLFIGNIQAAGTGFTLTKATRVIFAEFSWVPGDNDQAADRAHRIGQQGNVLVQYLVFDASVDKAVIETLLQKEKVTTQL